MPTDHDILAALRSLPSETAADVRACASLERVFSDTELDSVEHERHRNRATRLSALADIFDTITITKPDVCPDCGGCAAEHAYYGPDGPEWRCRDERRLDATEGDDEQA